MSKEQIIRKITSRKFILTLFLLVFGILCITGIIPIEKQEQWKGIVVMGAGVVAYILGEGATDIAGIIKQNQEEENGTDNDL